MTDQPTHEQFTDIPSADDLAHPKERHDGWSEAVWHQGEEVGTRERWSAPLFLAALSRLDKMADGLDMKGHPARAAAEHFDALLEGIGQGSDCAELVEEIDVSDLDIAEREEWDEFQWERADRSGLLKRSGLFDELPEPV